MNTKRSIRNVLVAVKESKNVQETTYYENQIACIFTTPTMFLASILNFIVGYLILHNELKDTLIVSVTLLVFGFLFLILLYIKLKVNVQTYVLTIIYSLWFIYMFNHLYEILGPAIWTFAYIQIAFAMARIKKIIGYSLTLITLTACVYFMFSPTIYEFQKGLLYYLPQLVSIIIMFFVLNIMHKSNSDRYYNLLSQFDVVVKQRNNITSLYDEVAKTEVELRKQNEQLLAYMEEIKKRDEKLYDLAYFDLLTRLPNRKLFMEKLNQHIDKSTNDNKRFYVIYIDVDSFKKINDTMGHQVGDDYIHFAANRLKNIIHEDDILGRLGGDEFALIISRNLNEDELFCEVENIRNIFSKPLNINNKEISSTASFGISVFPRDGSDASELLKSADMSMYKAKEYGKNNVKFFQKYMQEEIEEKAKIESKLNIALEKNQFYLVFQPQYTINKEKIRGFEALIRWKSPELGLIQPNQFIPIAEENRMIIPIGEWVLKTACAKFKKLQEQYNLDSYISVNISTVQLMDDNFLKIVKSTLKETGLKPEYLELEITESVFIESLDNVVNTLKELKQTGIKVALDDFGTRFSTLSYLDSLPIDTIKIDRSFMNSLSLDSSQVKVIEEIIILGHNLGCSVIAEGVEYDHQLQYLRNHACDYIQGFIYDKPLEELKLLEMFQKQKK